MGVVKHEGDRDAAAPEPAAPSGDAAQADAAPEGRAPVDPAEERARRMAARYGDSGHKGRRRRGHGLDGERF